MDALGREHEEHTMRQAMATYERWNREDERLKAEVAELFTQAQELGQNHFAPHCVAEAGLEYATDEELYLALIDLDEAAAAPE